jgi:hypothetical protein
MTLGSPEVSSQCHRDTNKIALKPEAKAPAGGGAGLSTVGLWGPDAQHHMMTRCAHLGKVVSESYVPEAM